MASQALIEAARNNGRKSRGPKTAAGKLKSAANSRKHGLDAKSLPPSPQFQAEYARTLPLMLDLYCPAGPYQTELVKRMACYEIHADWAFELAGLYIRLECDSQTNPAIWRSAGLSKRPGPRAANLLFRRAARLRRRSAKALWLLIDLQERTEFAAHAGSPRLSPNQSIQTTYGPSTPPHPPAGQAKTKPIQPQFGVQRTQSPVPASTQDESR